MHHQAKQMRVLIAGLLVALSSGVSADVKFCDETIVLRYSGHADKDGQSRLHIEEITDKRLTSVYTGLSSLYWGKNAEPDFMQAVSKSENDFWMFFKLRAEHYINGELVRTVPFCKAR